MQRLRTQGVGCGHEIDTINIRHSKDTLTVLSEFSRSLSEYSAAINKDSDNFLAENLFKLTGALYGNYKNNAAGAKSVRDSVIKHKKIFSKGISINDGSGLSRNNLLSAKTLLDILIAANKSNMRVEFDSTLSIAGVDGTLKRRMKNTAAEANLIAKTGTLRNASALAGYCTTLDGERLAFAFIFNGNDVHSYKETEDKLGALMSQFFYFHKEN
jgi:PBP4 family serine-type D-alanyl-D-alanine carboxypeptidase